MVAIVTDSTCDLSPELIQQYNIKVIPLHIHFGGQSYIDNINISQDEFYAKLTSENTPHPSTSPPSVEEFHEFYTKLVPDHDNIISIHISSSLSHTYKHAMRAVNRGRRRFLTERLKVKRFNKLHIRVIESNNVSLGAGILVLYAAKWAQQGMSGAQIEKQALAIRERLRIVFTVNELTYMRRSEKVSALKHFLGSLLGINPVIEGAKSALSPVKSAKGIDHAMQFIAEHTLKNIDLFKFNTILVSEIGGNNKPHFKALSQYLKTQDIDKLSKQIPCNIGPSVGTHAGPGGVAVAFIAKK